MRQLADYQLRYLVQCLAVNAAMICVTREGVAPLTRCESYLATMLYSVAP